MHRYKVLNKSDGVATKKAIKNRVHVSRKNKKKEWKIILLIIILQYI